MIEFDSRTIKDDVKYTIHFPLSEDEKISQYASITLKGKELKILIQTFDELISQKLKEENK